MAREEKILEQLDQLSRMTLGVDSDVDEGKLNQISSLLVDMDDNLREGVQGQSAAAMEAIIRCLHEEGEISREDLALIRLWMVSDAEFYVQMENDFHNWIIELNRIFSNISSLRKNELTPETMGKISGSIRDGLRVIADVIYFRQQEQRIERFERATRRLYSEDKLHLARILSQKLLSDAQ